MPPSGHQKTGAPSHASTLCRMRHSRHTFATDALNKGVPLQQVAAFLGNSMRIVEKHYGTWGDEQQRNADEALARTFQKEPDTVETDGGTEPGWVEKKSRLGTRKVHEKRVVN